MMGDNVTSNILANRVLLFGEVNSELNFSHDLYGEKFYSFILKVKRLSNYCDLLPITISERLLAGVQLLPGQEVSINGQLRSYNKYIDGRGRLILTVFAKEISFDTPQENPNLIVLKGYVCKPPIYRTTPFNREIADLLIAVNRAYNKSDYIPCIAWGRNAKYAQILNVGEMITIEGRIQSREYEKVTEDGATEKRIAYEVSVIKIYSKQEEDKIVREP